MLRESGFLRRLRRELPVWVRQGWVTPGSEQQILDHVAAQRSPGARDLPLAFSMLGVLLLSAGVITFLAANWSVMPKVAKLAILFGGMWLAYAGAGYALRHGGAPQLGEALLLLGVILFGSNIMLIGQIYHIDAHYPNGVLLWALGGMATAYLMHSQPAMITAIALATLWTGMETFGFDRSFHWPFLILWASCLPAISRKRWMPALHVAMIGLLLWSWFAFQHITWSSREWGGGAPLYLMQIYFLAYLGMFLLGLVMATYGHLSPFSGVVQRYSAFASLASLYVLTFPDLHRGVEWGTGSRLRVAAHGPWVMVTVIALAVVIALALWHRVRTSGVDRPIYLKWADGLLGLTIALVLANLFLTGTHGGPVAIAFNLLFLAGLVWLIYAGMHGNDRSLINMAFLFFGLGLLSRYFDTFWTLLNRSYFFMGGGLLLIGGGYLLEKQRRKLTARMQGTQAQGGRP
jgi:uncharacterized membrane protein